MPFGIGSAWDHHLLSTKVCHNCCCGQTCLSKLHTGGSFTRKQELILLVHGHLSITTMKTMPPTHMELELASYHYSCTCEFTHTIAMNFITPIVLSLYLGVVKQLCKRGHPKGIHPDTPTHPHSHTHSHHTQTHSHAELWLCKNRMHTHTGDSFTWNTNTYLDSPAYP